MPWSLSRIQSAVSKCIICVTEEFSIEFQVFRQILGTFKKIDGKNENLVRFCKKIRKFKANVGITFSQRLTRKWKKNEKCKKLNIEKYSKKRKFLGKWF